MNFLVFRLCMFAMPLVINGYFFDFPSMILKKNNSDQSIDAYDFEAILISCVNVFGFIFKDPDYEQCIYDDWDQIKYDDDDDCCFRMVIYKCTKELLTAKCHIDEDLVEVFDVIHFNFWRNCEEYGFGDGNCTGDKQQLLQNCKLSFRYF